ncbi:DNA repair protein rad52 [Verticillium nonalfalfae]|uniref:RAD52 homolog n=1 Tax=Verticillium nonalfalfae TaxID=1051616 RepID=A0A3M9YGC2_9PEZI|nr:DNA repair protein rad52 [Verticillium nonalfalfae]RNJ58180.1 DNA repair protein rad52 [Verticillium nonalfalfae]
MPAPGDQHSGNLANPFEEPQKRMTEYTAQQIATLQSRLEKQLGPEYISARAGPSGQKVHYIAAEKCIALANEVFGFNGWSSGIQNIQVDFVDEHPQTLKISLGLSVIVRVTLRDGTFHEDIGYGHIENCKGKAAAFEKAKKEGTTDALKRALRNFGNVLGNCIYDKDYLAKVTKLKPGPTKFDENKLHRHSDFAKKEEKEKEESLIKKEMADSLDDLLDADFDEMDFAINEEGHPDEIVLPPANNPSTTVPNQAIKSAQNMQPPSRPMGRSVSAGNVGNMRGPQTPTQGSNMRQAPQGAYQNRPVPPNQPRAPANIVAPAAPQNIQRANNGTPPPNAGSAAAAGTPESVGFFSARAVKDIPESKLSSNNPNAALSLAPGQHAFNPKAESPSIRKTPGIDHSSSKPVSRNGQHVPPAASQSGAAGGGGISNASGFTPQRPTSGPQGGMGNPQLSQTRRIGAPAGPASPLANRNSYRAPTMIKRPVPQEGATGRPPLAEVVNKTGPTVNSGSEMAAVDAAKRQRTS